MPRNSGRMAALAVVAALATAAVLLRGCAGPPAPERRAPPPTPDTPPETTALEGWAVRKGTVEPLAVQVAVTLGDGSVSRTTAGADGNFRLDGLPRGSRVDAELSFPGLATVRMPWLTVPWEGTFDIAGVSLGAPRAVTVRILRADGHPVPGAALRLLEMPARISSVPFVWDATARWPEIARASTDDEGRATVASVSVGTYRLEAGAPGMTTAVRSIRIHEGQDPESMDLVLGAGAALDVEVSDAAGRPAAGVLVRVVWDEVVVEVPTGADGSCRLEGLEPGTAVVWGLLPSGARVGGDRVEVPSGERIRLAAGNVEFLRGRVRDAETGAGLGGAVVTLVGQPFDLSTATTIVQAVTGAGGAFEIPRPAGRLLQLLAAARDHLDGRWNFDGGRPTSLSPGGPADLALRPARRIRGTVLGEDGSPVPGATVQLAQATGPGGFAVGSSTSVRPDGSFTLSGARPGPAMVKALAPGWWQPGYPEGKEFAAALQGVFPPSCSVVVPEKGEGTIALVLRRGGTVSGTVVNGEGLPQAGKRISLFGGGAVPWGTVESGRGGTFVFRGVAPGKDYSFSLDTSGGGHTAVQRLEVPDGGSVEGLRLTVPPARSVHGVVLDASGGPAAGARVRVLPGSDKGHWEYGPTGPGPSGTCGADGTFRVADLLEAPAQVVLVRHPGHAEGAVNLVGLGEGEVRGPVEVRLRRELPIAGVVVDEDGRPVPGAEVAAGTAHGTTDPSGRFLLRGLAEWPTVVAASASGFVPEYGPVQGGETRIALLRARTIEGTVRNSGSGEPLAGAQVSASLADSSKGSSYGGATSDAGGRFRIQGLRPGIHSISAQAPGSWLSPPPTQVEAGAGPVVIELERGFPLAGRVLDAEGRPVAQGFVGLGPAGGPYKESCQIGADGSFRFPALRAGRYLVTACPQGWRRGQERTGDLVAAELEDVEAGREDLEIRLLAGVDIRGRIVDATEQAGDLALTIGVTVTGTGRPRDGEIRWVKALKDGTFVLPGLDPRRGWDVFLKGHGAGIGSALRGVRQGGGDAELVLGAGYIFAGRVLDEAGAPLAGLKVKADALDARGPEDGISVESNTDREGVFFLRGLGAFRFRIHVRTGGTDWAPAEVEAVAGNAGSLDMRLRPGAAIEGSVAGKGDGRLTVGALPVDGPESSGSYGGVREDGTFVIRGLAPGPHRLKIIDNIHQDRTKDAGIVEAPATGLTLRWE